jgi:hypothetical protein
MLLRENMTNVAGTVKRSSLYHVLSTIVPINHAWFAKFDALGAAIVVALLVGSVDLMRLFLAK